MTKRDARATEARPYGSGLDVMIHARFTPKLAAKLARMATSTGCSLSATLRRLVEQARPAVNADGTWTVLASESGAEREMAGVRGEGAVPGSVLEPANAASGATPDAGTL